MAILLDMDLYPSNHLLSYPLLSKERRLERHSAGTTVRFLHCTTHSPNFRLMMIRLLSFSSLVQSLYHLLLLVVEVVVVVAAAVT